MSVQRTLTVVTGNRNKAAEIEAITGWPVETIDIDIAEVQSLSVEEVAKQKALDAFEVVKRPVVVDDTGMEIEALGGLPGALVSWFLDSLGPAGMLKLIQGVEKRRASVSTCIAYADANGAKTFVGTIQGSLAQDCTGKEGFGYDPIFIPDGHKRTYAEMSPEEKNTVSMRRQALLKLKDFLSAIR